jgi:hypothetical protein
VHFWGYPAKFGTGGHPNWNAQKHVTNMGKTLRKILNCCYHASQYISVAQKGFVFESTPVQAAIISNKFRTTQYLQSPNNIIFTYMAEI